MRVRPVLKLLAASCRLGILQDSEGRDRESRESRKRGRGARFGIGSRIYGAGGQVERSTLLDTTENGCLSVFGVLVSPLAVVMIPAGKSLFRRGHWRCGPCINVKSCGAEGTRDTKSH